MKRYRATIIIRGACPEYAYGTNLQSLEKAAIKKLTYFEPGQLSVWPDRIEIKEHRHAISGNRAAWGDVVKTVLLKDVPEDAREYVQRRKAREAKRVMENGH